MDEEHRAANITSSVNSHAIICGQLNLRKRILKAKEGTNLINVGENVPWKSKAQTEPQDMK